MASYPPDARITVLPYSHHDDGDTVTIGHVERQVFLGIPAEGKDLLDWLAAGHSVGETSTRFQDKHGEKPDLDDFLDIMIAEGFVTVSTATGSTVTAPEPVIPSSVQPAPEGRKWRTQLSWITEDMARKIFSTPVLVVCGLIILGGLSLAITNPGLVPNATILLFPEHFALLTWTTIGIMVAGIFLHEMAHLVAARAAGIPARMGIGNRLYILVAETDMSGIWLAPKRARYIAFLSGPIVDGVFGSIFIGLLYLMRNGTLAVPPEIEQLTGAALWTCFGRLLWQCFFFMHTDFYYTITTALGAKSLIADTEKWMRNQLRKLWRSPKREPLHDLTRKEMRAVRLYSLVYLFGRGITFWALFYFTLPVLIGYLTQAGLFVTGQDSRINSIDFATIVLVAILLDGGGLYVSSRNLIRRVRKRRTDAAAAADRREAAARALV